MADLVKRQHYVPRTYLKHFGFLNGAENFINVFPNIENENEKIFETNIKNVALEKNLYTLPGETIEQKMAIEKFYADELEQHYDKIYEILINPNKIEITSEERSLIISTVVTMYYRTTKWVNLSRNLMSRVFTQMFELCEQTGKDYFNYEGEKISIAGKSLEEFTIEFNDERQPGMILIQLETAFKLIALRSKFDAIVVAKLNNENCEYVTSDNPVIASNPKTERVIPFNHENLLYLPLDSKHMLILVPEVEKGNENRIFRKTYEDVRSKSARITSNYQQMANSERFVFGSKSSLELYLKTKSLTEKPLTEKEANNPDIINEILSKLD